MQRIAFLTLLSFGCATVRVPAAIPGDPIDAPGVIAPPVTELWLESSEDVPMAERSKADAEARAALGAALAGREIDRDAAGASDAVLFVRERAVGTTDARRSQQTWAKVGIVAAIVVVVVAVVVVAVTAGKGGSGSHGTAAKSAPAARSAPVAVRPRVVPASPPRLPPPVPAYHAPPVFVSFSVNFWIPPRPVVLAPEPGDDAWYPPEPPAPLLSDAQTDEEALALAGAPPAPDPLPDVPPMVLRPLAPAVTFRVEDRGFFDGPLTAIQLDVVDRRTGRTVWWNAVRADVDPRDPEAVAKLVDQALAGQSWARRVR